MERWLDSVIIRRQGASRGGGGSGGVTPVAPVLTNPTDTAIGSSTATLTVDTDQATGTLYVVVTLSSTPPSKAQVKARQDSAGATASFADNQAVVSSGTKTINASGLTAATQYYSFFMHENGTGQQSNVAAADGFMSWYAARDIVMGVTPPASGGSNAPSSTYIFSGRPVWEDGTLSQFRCYANATATLKLKIFRRSGNILTWISEQSLSVVAGLNTFSVGGGTLTGVSVLAGDIFAVYSVTNNFIQYKTPTISGTEYYSDASDVVTTLTVGNVTPPSQGIQLQAEFTVSVVAKPAVPAVGSIIYCGEPSPSTGSGGSSTSDSYFEDQPWVTPVRLETLQIDAAADGYVLMYILTPASTGYTSRVFAVSFASGMNNLVAGTDFPIDVLLPVGGTYGFWTTGTAIYIDVTTQRPQRHLDATITGGTWPTSPLTAFMAIDASVALQIKAGFRPYQALALTTTLLDWTFSAAIPPWFTKANWSISGGVATNSANGLLNSVLWRTHAYYDSAVTAWVTFTGATDKFAVLRSPEGDTNVNFGTVATIDLSTNKIAILNFWDGSASVPTVNTEKVSTITFQTAREYTMELARLNNTITLTVTDTVAHTTDSLSIDCWSGAPPVSYAAGRCYGTPGFASLTGTQTVSRMTFTVPVASPLVLEVGDSITDGQGSTTQANSYAGLVKTGVSGSAAIAGVGGSRVAYPLSYMEQMTRQFLPTYATLLIGANDGVYATWQARIVATIDYVQMTGVNLWIGAVIPQVGNTIPELQMNPYLRANYASQVISFDYALTTGRTGLAANLIGADFYDSLHPNDTGYAAMYVEEQATVPFV